MRVLTAVLFLALSATSALSDKLATAESKFGVKETLDRLADALDKRGIKVAARIDHAAGAKTAGMELPPTQVLIFGNPKLGTPLMQSNRAIGIDLPMKVMAWEDNAGKVWVGYTAPETLKARHGITDRDQVFAAMSKALEGLVATASGQ